MATRPRVVKCLNARQLQIWGSNGEVQASFSGGDASGPTLMLGEGAELTSSGLVFRSKGVVVSTDPLIEDEKVETEGIERLQLGIDSGGSAVLRFYSDRELDSDPTPPVTELKVTRSGQHSLSLGVSWPSVEVREDRGAIKISPGGVRVTVVGPGGRYCGSGHAIQRAGRRRQAMTAPHSMRWDVFLCHAGEDQRDIVEPLAAALSDRPVKVWFAGFEVTGGDDLRRKIEEGLTQSRYGTVILSPSFFGKPWPERELTGLVQRNLVEGRTRVPAGS